WAGGDITGIGAFTHLSWYHGKLIGRQLKGEDAVADHRAIPRVTFTDPEVASVGLSEATARKELSEVRVVSADSGNGTRGYINGPPGGVIKLVADMQRNVLVGALVVGPRAGEMIAELTLAIRAEVPLAVLEDTLHAFPAFSRDLDGLFPQLVD
ncbi:MAG: NAD(P)/FAD-dependent oxidoreductase, partial [Candidatus Dormibacteraeota bacterium]|nr:NAD(P)/FAD-dependent oxidoreductase [Candidatus Dormibacteraeota bacterium]